MSLKDKLEIGLKPDAPYRPDNLPEIQKDDEACEIAAQPGESPKLRRARDVCDDAGQPLSRNMRGVAPPKRGRMAKSTREAVEQRRAVAKKVK